MRSPKSSSELAGEFVSVTTQKDCSVHKKQFSRQEISKSAAVLQQVNSAYYLKQTSYDL